MIIRMGESILPKEGARAGAVASSAGRPVLAMLVAVALLAAVAAAESPPDPVDLSSAACAAAAGSACWTAASADGDRAVVDGRGSVEVAALVPGDIYDDLMHAGVIGDIWHGNGTTLSDAAWVGWRTWHFSREFHSPVSSALASSPPSRWRRWLRFQGVQYNCTVELNNMTLGDHIGQFQPFEYDVTELLRPAGQTNRLVVTTHPLLDNLTDFTRQIETKTSDQRDYTGQVSCWLNRNAPQWLGRTMYGWDFVPAVYSAGISNEVSLYTTAALPPAPQAATATAAGAVTTALVTAPPATLRAEALQIIPRLSPPYDSARLELGLEVRLSDTWPSPTSAAAPSALTVRFNISSPKGVPAAGNNITSVFVFNVSAGASAGTFVVLLRANLTLPRPELWWPNGAHPRETKQRI
jgi:hypothetical protein